MGADKCDVCHRIRWATTLHWVCKRCEETAQAVSTGQAAGDSEIIVTPRARRPFRQLFALALLVSLAVIAETLIIAFH
jgi:hypothetical protein